jgi:hypothetical protein
MKKILFLSVLLSSCSTTDCIHETTVINEPKKVENNCRLLIKQICPDNSFLGCYRWHDKKARAFKANKVVIIGKIAQYWDCKLKRF